MHWTRPQHVSLRRAALGSLLALLISTITMLPLAPAANASPGAGDDRQLSAVTGWWTYTGQSASALGSKLTANGARLTDLRVESVSGTGVPTFTAVMVKNSSSYASGWWWYYGLTAAQVNTQLSNHTARPISVQGYGTPSGLRFAVIMVDNSGAKFKAYSWWYGTATFINSHVTSTNRLISFSSILGTTSYVGVFTNNTGTNATGWWWYYGKSTSQISTLLTTNHARIVDLDRNTNGTYNVVMYSNRSTRWYWYYGQSISTAVARALQQGERIIDVTPYFVGGVKFFAVVSTNNLNSLSGKLWAIVAPRIDSGSYGFYLKQVGGSTTLAGVQSTLKYEPASALKVLYHAKSIHQEALGTTTDSTVITYHFNPADPTNAGICPDDYATTSTTNLKNADTLMMQNSDNRMTRGVLEKYTKPAMLSYAAALGLTSTSINHNIGCPTSATHNYTTLVDLGRIYEAFQNGTVTTNAAWKSHFRSRMLNESNYSGFRNLICPIVSQEAASLGKSAAIATSFCNALTFIAKGGDYAYGGSLPRTESHDDFWLSGVPYKSRGVLAPKYFLLGEFVDNVHIDSTDEFDSMNAARSKLKQEALRPYIRAALMTW